MLELALPENGDLPGPFRTPCDATAQLRCRGRKTCDRKRWICTGTGPALGCSWGNQCQVGYKILIAMVGWVIVYRITMIMRHGNVHEQNGHWFRFCWSDHEDALCWGDFMGKTPWLWLDSCQNHCRFLTLRILGWAWSHSTLFPLTRLLMQVSYMPLVATFTVRIQIVYVVLSPSFVWKYQILHPQFRRILIIVSLKYF